MSRHQPFVVQSGGRGAAPVLYYNHPRQGLVPATVSQNRANVSGAGIRVVTRKGHGFAPNLRSSSHAGPGPSRAAMAAQRILAKLRL